MFSHLISQNVGAADVCIANSLDLEDSMYFSKLVELHFMGQISTVHMTQGKYNQHVQTLQSIIIWMPMVHDKLEVGNCCSILRNHNTMNLSIRILETAIIYLTTVWIF